MVGVSASVNLPLHHKVHKFLLAPAHPHDPGKRAVKRLCVCVFMTVILCVNIYINYIILLNLQSVVHQSQIELIILTSLASGS